MLEAQECITQALSASVCQSTSDLMNGMRTGMAAMNITVNHICRANVEGICPSSGGSKIGARGRHVPPVSGRPPPLPRPSPPNEIFREYNWMKIYWLYVGLCQLECLAVYGRASMGVPVGERTFSIGTCWMATWRARTADCDWSAIGSLTQFFLVTDRNVTTWVASRSVREVTKNYIF